MRAVEQVKPEHSSSVNQPSSFHAELHSIWGPPPAFIKQAQDFTAGVGEGFGNAVNEGAKAVAQAVSNPGEALHKAVDETGRTVKGVLSATEAAGEYIGDHAVRGDMSGVVRDAQKTSHDIEHILAAGIEHVSKMNAHDLGKFVGHDVLPGAIVAVAAPELAGESIALAASAASKIGTIAKDAAVLSKVAGAYESATSKIAVISEKMAGLNKKMETLQHDVRCTQKLDGEGFEHNLPKFHKSSPCSESFRAHVKECQEKLEPWVRAHLEKVGIEIHPIHRIADLPKEISKDRERVPAITIAHGDHKGIYIAEQVWHKNDWVTHHPVDVLFNMFHETGHALNATLKHDLLSSTKEFATLFNRCWENVDKSQGAGRIIANLVRLDAMQDEVMADMWGHLHATPHPDNTYSNSLRKMFAPIYEHMKEWRLR